MSQPIPNADRRTNMQGTMLALMIFGLGWGPAQVPQAEAVPRPDQETPSEPLGFASKRANFEWDRIIPLDMSVDGLSVKSIFFNKRGYVKGPLKGATFGTRARVEVVNTSGKKKDTGFAVAVFDEKDNLLGVASGGNAISTVKSGQTTTFELNFFQVKERLQRGAYFFVSVELID
jgi:hypothetical protein